MQKGPLWWAGHHVNHHRFADRDGDPHSPMVSGIYYAHIGWFLNDARHDRLEAEQSRDSRFLQGAGDRLPREVLRDSAADAGGRDVPRRRHAVAGLGLLPADDDAGARDVRHQLRQPLFGSRRFDTIDESRNNAITAFFAVGEGWHNNHHRYQRAARNGFYWWEFDPTWYVIRLMAAVGLAWDVQPVPERIYEEARASKARRATAAFGAQHHGNRAPRARTGRRRRDGVDPALGLAPACGALARPLRHVFDHERLRRPPEARRAAARQEVDFAAPPGLYR